MATKIPYIDPNGQSQTGYAIDGKTYVDEAGTTRIPVGSKAYAGGQLWDMTANGGVAYNPITAGSGQPASGNSIINQIYDQQLAQQKADLEAAYTRNVNTLSAQKAKIPETYNTFRNQAASQSETQRANFNQYANASGLSSGAAGQAQLSFGTTLQSNLGALDKAQAQATSDADLALSNLSAQYKRDIQAAIANGELQKAKTMYDNLQTQYARQTEQKQYADSLAMNKAQTLAQYGDFSGYEALGYTPEQIANMNAAYIKSMTPKYTGTGSGGGTPKYDYNNLYSAMLSSGNPILYLQSNYKNYGLQSGGLESVLAEYARWAEQASGTQANNYASVKMQAQSMLGMMGAGGYSGGNVIDDIASYLGQAVDSGQISQADGDRILREMGLVR